MGKDFVSTIVSSAGGLNSVLIGAISAEFFASRGAETSTSITPGGATTVTYSLPCGRCADTLQVFPHCPQRHLPRPFGAVFIFPDSASLYVSFVPAWGLRAGTEQHALMYSLVFGGFMLGFAFGLFDFAHCFLFSSRLRFGRGFDFTVDEPCVIVFVFVGEFKFDGSELGAAHIGSPSRFCRTL